MIIKYKLEYSFGPIGSFAGKFAFFSSILGMIFSEFNVFALIFLLIPAFLGFSKTHIYIDTEKIRVKFSTTIFGLIPTGKLGLGLIKSSGSILVYLINRWN